MCFPEAANRMLHRLHAISRTWEEQHVLWLKCEASFLNLSVTGSLGQIITYGFTFQLLLSSFFIDYFAGFYPNQPQFSHP